MTTSSARTLIVALCCLSFVCSAVSQQFRSPGNVPELTLRRIWDGNEVPASTPSVSPDGRNAAFIESGNVFVRELSISNDANRRITDLSGTISAQGIPAWSPDSKQIAFRTRSGAQIAVVNLDGTGLRTIYNNIETSVGFPLGWSPDGKRILSGTNSSQSGGAFLWIGLDDGAMQRITTRAIPNGASISPDGRIHRVFWACGGG